MKRRTAIALAGPLVIATLAIIGVGSAQAESGIFSLGPPTCENGGDGFCPIVQVLDQEVSQITETTAHVTWPLPQWNVRECVSSWKVYWGPAPYLPHPVATGVHSVVYGYPLEYTITGLEPGKAYWTLVRPGVDPYVCEALSGQPSEYRTLTAPLVHRAAKVKR